MNSFYVQLLAIIALLAANAFFVAAEFALVSARHFRIETRAKGGSSAARMTLRIKENIDAYLSACQLGITMASLGLGWLGEPAVAAILKPLLEPLHLSDATLHTISFVIGFIVFSSLHIVIGEQVPKTYAIRKAVPVSILLAYPLHWFYIAIFPLSWSLNWASISLLRLMGVKEARHAEVLTSDELKGLIHVSAEHGEVEAERATMLHNLFHFDERTVEGVMIPRTETKVLRTEASAAENLETIRKSQYSRFPIVSDGHDNLIGIILVRDLVNAMVDGAQAPWENLKPYCRDPLVVPESLHVSTLFEMMRTKRAHMACVIDEYGSFVGIVTLEDLLEEIVGEIADETDKVEQEFSIVWKADHWDAHGLASLVDFERETGFVGSEEYEVKTVSGLVMSLLGRIPRVKDIVELEGFRFTVLEMKDRRIERVRIARIDDETAPAEEDHSESETKH